MLEEFKKRGASVVGLSKDSLQSHAKFRTKYGFEFPLLSDPSREVLKAYGAWGKKMNYGKESEGTVRSTAVIGPDSRIERFYGNVKAQGHAASVLADLD